MRRQLLPLGWILAAAGCCFPGCRHAPSAIPSDPLFVSKKPLLSTPELKPPNAVASLEPEVPGGPDRTSADQRRNAPPSGEQVVPARHTFRGQMPQ